MYVQPRRNIDIGREVAQRGKMRVWPKKIGWNASTPPACAADREPYSQTILTSAVDNDHHARQGSFSFFDNRSSRLRELQGLFHQSRAWTLSSAALQFQSWLLRRLCVTLIGPLRSALIKSGPAPMMPEQYLHGRLLATPSNVAICRLQGERVEGSRHGSKPNNALLRLRWDRWYCK